MMTAPAPAGMGDQVRPLTKKLSLPWAAARAGLLPVLRCMFSTSLHAFWQLLSSPLNSLTVVQEIHMTHDTHQQKLHIETLT